MSTTEDLEWQQLLRAAGYPTSGDVTTDVRMLLNEIDAARGILRRHQTIAIAPFATWSCPCHAVVWSSRDDYLAVHAPKPQTARQPDPVLQRAADRAETALKAESDRLADDGSSGTFARQIGAQNEGIGAVKSINAVRRAILAGDEAPDVRESEQPADQK